MRNKAKILCTFLILIFLLSSCSTLNNRENQQAMPNNFETKNEILFDKFISADNDPLESLNRRIYYFNYLMDENIITPIVNVYKFITPDFVENRVTNFFRNLKTLNTTANATMQLKGRKAMRALARFTINTILGLGGTFDVASSMGMPKPYEDFGLTLAHYGVPKGPYLILPFLGPSYLRDAFGMGVETLVRREFDLYKKVNLFKLNSPEIILLQSIDKRKNINFSYFSSNSAFEYEYVRFLYNKYRDLQEKTNLQYF